MMLKKNQHFFKKLLTILFLLSIIVSTLIIAELFKKEVYQ